MKKHIISFILIFIIGIFLGRAYTQNIENPRDFKVQQIFVNNIGDTKETRMNVIVTTDDYDVDKMLRKIRKHHNFVYGEAERLNILLFNSEDDFINFDIYAEETFNK